MSSSRLRIESVTVGDLYEFACEFLDNAKGQVIAPITRDLALSQSKNPHARPDDVALMLAYVGDLCVGHQGLLPVRVESPHGQGRAFWLTGLYVLPEYRTKLVAVRLVKEVRSLNLDCVLNQFSEESRRLFSAMGFKPIQPLPYSQIRFDRLDPIGEILYPLHKRFEDKKVVADVAAAGVRFSGATSYGLSRSLYFSLLKSRIRKELAGVSYHEVDRVRAADPPSHRSGTRFVRGAEAVNWTLEYPWVRDSGDPTNPPYFFPEVVPTYRDVAIEIDNGRGDVGFVFMTLIGNGLRSKLKVRDFQLPEDVDSSAAFWIACDYAKRLKADIVELPSHLAGPIDALPFGGLLRKDLVREYLFRAREGCSSLSTFAEDAILSLNDGDTAFF
jgi:GNAT superfamily N-acetyltransferase